MLMLYGIVPDQWLRFADGELNWRKDVFWPEKGVYVPGTDGRGRIMIPLEVYRDIVATLIYVVALVLNVWGFVWWQKRGQKKPDADELTSAYGRPLVRGQT